MVSVVDMFGAVWGGGSPCGLASPHCIGMYVSGSSLMLHVGAWMVLVGWLAYGGRLDVKHGSGCGNWFKLWLVWQPLGVEKDVPLCMGLLCFYSWSGHGF